MIDIVGLISIGILILSTLVIKIKYPAISKIILAALLIRILFLLINEAFFPLPDATMDAKYYEEFAWIRSEGEFKDILNYFKNPDAYFISSLISIPYYFVGRSIIMAQSFSIFFGLGLVFLGWLLSKKLWNDNVASKVGWSLALYPTLVSYSVIVMREVYFSFFLILAVFGIFYWIKNKNFKSILLIFFGFIGAGLFHGPAVVGLFIFITYLMLIYIYQTFNLLKSYKINFLNLIFIFSISFILYLYFSSFIEIGYLGTFDYMTNFENLRIVMDIRTKGGASYPDWTKVNEQSEFIYKLPIRVLYFLFSPFPWDIQKFSHFIGLIDSILILILVYSIFLNRKQILKNDFLKLIFIMLVCYIVIYSVGVSNFGTGIRHRSKFIFLLILLAAPYIPALVFNKSKKKNNT